MTTMPTAQALDLVHNVARHINTAVAAQQQNHEVLQLQELFVGDVCLVAPGRVLHKKGMMTKVGPRALLCAVSTLSAAVARAGGAAQESAVRVLPVQRRARLRLQVAPARRLALQGTAPAAVLPHRRA
jgi:hypothetical protein